MREDQHQVKPDKDRKQTKTRQMDHAGAIVTAEKQRQEMKLNWFVNR
jgi:hypothetical protein